MYGMCRCVYMYVCFWVSVKKLQKVNGFQSLESQANLCIAYNAEAYGYNWICCTILYFFVDFFCYFFDLTITDSNAYVYDVWNLLLKTFHKTLTKY